MRSGQRDLVEKLLPEIEIDLENEKAFSLAALFADDGRQVWLEIGFGGGEHLAWQASRNPDIGLIGCEPYLTGVVKLLTKIRADGLENVRLFRDDARLLVDCLPNKSLHRAFILFPDPWPKLRHHKRRIVSDSVLDRLAGALVDGAQLRIATDDPGYLEWILWHMGRRKEFDWQARSPADWRNRPEDWPPTRYEEKAISKGCKCAFLTYTRKPR